MSGARPQGVFLAIIAGAADQKTFKIVDPRGPADSVREIDLTLVHGTGEAEAGAEPSPWVVDVRYSNAPDVELFTKNFTDEKTARTVMEDFSKLAAEIEGLVRAEKLDEAATKSAELEKKFTSNSSESPVELGE
jgi:hypothetical protein